MQPRANHEQRRGRNAVRGDSPNFGRRSNPELRRALYKLRGHAFGFSAGGCHQVFTLIFVRCPYTCRSSRRGEAKEISDLQTGSADRKFDYLATEVFSLWLPFRRQLFVGPPTTYYCGEGRPEQDQREQAGFLPLDLSSAIKALHSLSRRKG